MNLLILFFAMSLIFFVLAILIKKIDDKRKKTYCKDCINYIPHKSDADLAKCNKPEIKTEEVEHPVLGMVIKETEKIPFCTIKNKDLYCDDYDSMEARCDKMKQILK